MSVQLCALFTKIQVAVNEHKPWLLLSFQAIGVGFQLSFHLQSPQTFAEARARTSIFSCTLPCSYASILVPRGRAPFGQHQESRPLAWSNDIPVLNGFVNTIDWDQNQSDLSDLTRSMRRVTGSPWIVDFRCWTRPEVSILGADQKERGLWGREWYVSRQTMMIWRYACVRMKRTTIDLTLELRH